MKQAEESHRAEAPAAQPLELLGAVLVHVPRVVRALEAQVPMAVAQPRVLVRLRVGVHPDHARCARGEHVRAVALTTRHIDHTLAGNARRDPFIHRLVAAKPVVLLRHIRQRALPRQRQWRNAVGLVTLLVERHGHGARVYGAAPCHRLSVPRRSATLTRATTTWQPITMTPSGGSTSASSAATRSSRRYARPFTASPGTIPARSRSAR